MYILDINFLFQVGDAIDVLETRMLKMDRVKPENYIYNLIIGECGRLGYTKKAFQLYNQMKKRDLKVTGATYTGLFNACANSPWPQDGLKRAKHLPFGRCGDLSTAFSLVDEMADKQLPIAENTFNFLFHACITDKEAGFRHALLVWRKMKDNRVKPDIYTFNLLLRSIRDCGLGDLDSAHNAKPALEAGDKPPIISLGSLEKEISTEQNSSAEETETKEPKPSQLTNLPVQITDNRPNLLAYKPQLGNIIGLTEITKPEDRLLLVGGCSGFLEQMKRDRVEPNIKTFTQLLDNIPSTKSAETALLSAMNKEGVVADIDFYNMLIKKRSMRSDYVGAREVLSLIRRAKVHPDIITFGVLALACRTQEEAESFLSDMKNAGFRYVGAICFQF
ncbi:Pentatricopeptide repeat-containing protein 1 [Blattella germanica]|nr:Pentatricopeptide repeat-containing protein 1 [Blattella germanica]